MTSSTPRRIASLTLAILVLSATLSVGPVSPVGTAEAATFQDCTILDSSIGGFTLMMFRTLAGAQEGCRLGSPETPDPGSEAMADIYAGAVAMHDSHETALTIVNNRLTDARAPATTEAKLAMLAAFNAGQNETQATEAATDAIEDYYSPIVANVNALWVQKVAYWNYSWRAEIQSTGSYGSWVGGQNMPLEEVDGDYRPTITTRNLTLPNGSTVPTKAIHGVPTPNQPGGQVLDVHWSDNAHLSGDLPTTMSNGADNSPYFQHGPQSKALIFLEVPVSGSNSWEADSYLFPDSYTVTGVDTPEETYHYYHEKIYDEIAQVTANVGPMVNATYQEYEPGDVDTTNVLSPTELASRAATDYNSTGYHAFLAAQLAMMGYSGNLPISHAVHANGTTYNGSLFYTGDDLAELEAGVTYDPATYTGEFVMAAQLENESAIVDLDEPFTITEMIDTRTGEVVANASMADYTAETTNATSLADELTRLLDAREELVEKDTKNSSGGGLFAGFGSWLGSVFGGVGSFVGSLFSGISTGVLLIGLAAVILLLGREG